MQSSKAKVKAKVITGVRATLEIKNNMEWAQDQVAKDMHKDLDISLDKCKKIVRYIIAEFIKGSDK